MPRGGCTGKTPAWPTPGRCRPAHDRLNPVKEDADHGDPDPQATRPVWASPARGSARTASSPNGAPGRKTKEIPIEEDSKDF